MVTNNKKRVLLITQELTPYLQLTDYAKTLNQLAAKANDLDMEVRIIMPRFGVINERRNRLHEVVRLSGINVIIDKDDHPLLIKVASLPNARLQVYFMDNEDFFKRKFVFRDKENNWFDDNIMRTAFFCKGALETVKKFGWPPDIIHCTGWMTSLIPLFLKTAYKREPVFTNAKSIYTLQENSFNEKLDESFLSKARIHNTIKEKDLAPFSELTNTALNLGGATYADAVAIGDNMVDEDLLTKIKENDKKEVFPYSDEENLIDNYMDFYEKLAPTS
ncbi:MAG TPA: glycogen/starch synthase [Chitinophagaceae bacterium]|nr:glycogen/starch synthase [Chitinophagaceae bacterium]